jgi:NAD-dependent dihydropyrimidine dehydrogenase PreA subunit
MGHQSDWRAINNEGNLIKNFSRPVRPGQAYPDIMLHLRIAAYLCGLGEIGFSKMFLSPQFGPRCRVGMVLTDVELEPDPIYDGPQLCNRCMACIKACPGQCFDPEKTIKVNLAGHEVEWADIDVKKCNDTFRGAKHSGVEQEKPYLEGSVANDTVPGAWSPFRRKPRNLYNTGQAVCGSRGCTRACMISLESRGVLQNTFKEKFRRRPVWSVDWSQADPAISDFKLEEKRDDVD